MTDTRQYTKNFKHKKYVQLAKDLAPLFTPCSLDNDSAELIARELEQLVRIKGGYARYSKHI